MAGKAKLDFDKPGRTEALVALCAARMLMTVTELLLDEDKDVDDAAIIMEAVIFMFVRGEKIVPDVVSVRKLRDLCNDYLAEPQQ